MSILIPVILLSLFAFFIGFKPSEGAARWRHKIYARTNNYFWLECVTCGEPRGGHERQGGTIWESPHTIDGVNRGMMQCKKHPESVYPT